MRNIFIVLFIVVLMTGCSATTSKISQMQQNFIKSFREPGEKNVSSPEDTVETYKCKTKKIHIENIEVLPQNVSGGKEINQRIRYALCSPQLSENIDGEIVRSIAYKGKKQFVDTTKYSFKTGTWNVDVFIEIPSGAEEGEYLLEVILKYGSEVIVKTEEFFVKGKSEK